MAVDLGWLSKVREEVAEPDLPIVDAHHHVWDRPGFRYMFEELQADFSAGHRIIGSVFVEASSRQKTGLGTMYRADGPEALRSLGESEFVNGLAAMARSGLYGPEGTCAGIVAYVDLRLAEEAQPVLTRHHALPRVRGVRNMTAWDADPAVANRDLVTHAGMLRDPQFRRGFAALAATGLCFDAWVFAPQIPEVIDLAEAFPQTRIVLNHAGGCLGAGSYKARGPEPFREWKADLSRLARCRNAYVKLGGMGSPRTGVAFRDRPRPPDSRELAELWRPYVETCIELFGADRCMFESNFPVDKQYYSYTTLWNAFKRITASCGAVDRISLFGQTAIECYGLELPRPAGDRRQMT
ncbi:MAG: amidohydrolase family protein [Rhodospirillales bacterium]|nr:amidohydrolase family protein [Rhodospirillales bacterium]MDE2200947.1 amidohydrolase family protein [Rhodospirillales bacterium]